MHGETVKCKNWTLKYVVTSEISWNLMAYFTKIQLYNLGELLLWIKKCTLASFVALGMRSQGNAPKNWEPIIGFSYLTMLQHTGRFRSRIS